MRTKKRLCFEKIFVFTYRGVNVDVCEDVDGELLSSVDDLDFSKGLRAFSIHSNHLDTTENLANEIINHSLLF